MIPAGQTPGVRLGARFHRVWAAVTVSSIGDGMRAVTLPLLAAQLTDDPRRIAFVALAAHLPYLLFSLPSGVLADRVDRRLILSIVDGLRALVVIVLAVLAAAHDLSLGLLVAASFVLDAGQAFFNGAWPGMLASIVEPGAIPRANARLEFSGLVAGSLFGAPLGAFLCGVSTALPLAVDAVSFAIAAALVFRIPGLFRQRTDAATSGPMSWAEDLIEGVRWLVRHPLLGRLLLLSGLTNLTLGGVLAILVLYTRESLGLSNAGYGLLSAAFALGGLAGAAVSPYLLSQFKSSVVLRLGVLGTGLVGIGVGLAPSGVVACLFCVVFGAVNVAWTLTVVSLRQSMVPDVLMGRVSMAYQMVAVGAGALGIPLAGMIAHAMGPRAPILAGAVLLFLGGCLVSTRPPGRHRTVAPARGARRRATRRPAPVT
jgi:MFS family permease